MAGFNATVFADDYVGRYRRYQALVERRMEAAALIATERAADRAKRQIRSQMTSAGLGRLGFGLGHSSDASKGRGVHRRGNGWSASGNVHIRSQSERTKGAIEAYTQGAEIRPVRARSLWIPTDEIQRIAGSRARGVARRISPEVYNRELASKYGPLIPITSIDGRPLLAVENVGVSAVGARGGRVRGLTKSGRPRRGDRVKQLAILFVGIPHTSRAARVNVNQIIAEVLTQMPDIFSNALRTTAN